jgi:hypothetical protein
MKLSGIIDAKPSQEVEADSLQIEGLQSKV